MRWFMDLLGAGEARALRAEIEDLTFKATLADNTIAELRQENVNLRSLVRAFRDVNADLDAKLSGAGRCDFYTH